MNHNQTELLSSDSSEGLMTVDNKQNCTRRLAAQCHTAPARAGVSKPAQRRAIARAARAADDEEEEAPLLRAQDAVEAAERLNSCLHAKLHGATKQMMDIMQDIASWEAKFDAVNRENERLTQEAAVLAAANGGIQGPAMNRIPSAADGDDDDVRSQSSSDDCVSLN